MSNAELDRINPAELAKAFAEKLQSYLSPADWQAMRERNALPEYAWPECASHDFCDPNMTMCDAFADMGIDAIGDSEAKEGSPEDIRLENISAIWNQAWDIARREYLTSRGDNGEQVQ